MPFYWERNPDGPFATLIRVAATYLDPENYDSDALKARQARGRRGDAGLQVRAAPGPPGPVPAAR